MTRLKKTLVIILTAILITTLSVGSIGFSAGTKKTIDAWYDTLKITYNGTEVTGTAQPFVIYVNGNGTTYIPLRAMATLFNKNIDWNEAASTAVISDKADTSIVALKTDIAIKDAKIAQLEEKVKSLEDKVAKSRLISLDDLEDQLNDDYDTYKDISFAIYLSGDSDSLRVRIDVKMDSYSSKWNNLTTSNRKSYIQDIVDDILDEYKGCDIDGYVRDSSSSSSSNKLLSFTVSSSGTVSIGSSSTKLSDLEDDLTDDYDNYFSGIAFSSVVLDGDEDDITFKVHIDYNQYKTKWDALSNSEIQRLMSKIYDDIEDEYGDADIEGYIYDTYNSKDLAKYRRSSSGSSRFERY